MLDRSLDGYDDRSGPHRRIAESYHLALQLGPGPVRDGLLESVNRAAYAALGKSIEHAQAALAAGRDQDFEQALRHLVDAGVEAAAALGVPWTGSRPAMQVPPGPAARRRTLGELRPRRRTLGELRPRRAERDTGDGQAA